MNLKDNSVLVTAGASGLGREIALEMARRGADVTVWDVNANGWRSFKYDRVKAIEVL